MIRTHILKLALRYLRTKWVVYISVLAIATTVCGIVFVMALMGWLIGMNRANIRGTLSDLTVRTDDFRGFDGAEELRDTLVALPGVAEAALVLEIKAVASNPRTGFTAGCSVVGIELDRMTRVTDLGRFALVGDDNWQRIRDAFSAPDLVAPALVGNELAVHLGVMPGLEFSGWTPTSFADGNDQRMRMLAPMRSNAYDFDTTAIYIPLESARTFRELPGRASGIMMALDGGVDPYATKRTIEALLAERGLGHLAVYTWEDQRRAHLDAMDAEGLVMNLMLMLFLFIAVFSVAAIFWMIVLSKQRDIGIARAMGASAASVAAVFIVFGLLVGVVAGGIGFGAGHALVVHWDAFSEAVEQAFARLNIEVSLDLYDPNLYYIERTELDINLGRDLSVYAATIVLCGAAGILPSLRAARTNVIENIKG